MTEAVSSFKRQPSYGVSLNTLENNPALEEVPAIQLKTYEYRSAKNKCSELVKFSRVALKNILSASPIAAATNFQAAVKNEQVMPYYLAVANSVLKKTKEGIP
jgi:hypothetical protein